MGNFQSDVRQTVRWRWIEYDDADGEAHTYGWWERSWQGQSNTPWYGQGVMRSIGNGLTGFANDVTFDLPDRIDRWMGREPTADANSSAYQTGAWIGFAAALLLPGPGKLKVGSKLLNVSVRGTKQYAKDLVRVHAAGAALKVMRDRGTNRIVGLRTASGNVLFRPKFGRGGVISNVEIITSNGTRVNIHIRP